MNRSCVLICALALGGMPAGSALATPNFPEAIRNDLGISAAPDCSICHVGEPGRGNVHTAFGQAMRARGLVPYDSGSVKAALTKMETDQVDSNEDGVTDVDQLKAGDDPNGRSNTPIQRYGCQANGVAEAGALATLFGPVLFLAAIQTARRYHRATRAPLNPDLL